MNLQDSGTTSPERVTKAPAEAFNLTVDYTARLPGSAVPASSVVTAVDLKDDTSATSIVVSGAATTTTTTAVQLIIAGVAGRSYKLTYTTTLDSAEILVDTIVLIVEAP